MCSFGLGARMSTLCHYTSFIARTKIHNESTSSISSADRGSHLKIVHARQPTLNLCTTTFRALLKQWDPFSLPPLPGLHTLTGTPNNCPSRCWRVTPKEAKHGPGSNDVPKKTPATQSSPNEGRSQITITGR